MATYQAYAGQGGKRSSFRPRHLQSLPPREAVPEIKLARPAKTRYPISLEDFRKLKDSAHRPIAGYQASQAASLTNDAAAGVMAPPAAAPTLGASFAGISATGWFPFDCTMAVGMNDLLLAVNSSVAIFDKTGGNPTQTTLTQWFSGAVPPDATIFDPKALYDQYADRWVLLAAAHNNNQQAWFLISVSQTADPRGNWWNYALDATVDGTTPTNNWGDYPSLGLDDQALYLTANMFQWGGDFQYAKLRIVPKASVYAGGTPTFTDFVGMTNADGSLVFTLQPCHEYGTPGVEYLVNSLYPSASNPTSNSITVWTVANPVTGPTLTSVSVITDPYGIPPHADQQGNNAPLDSGDVRMLNAVFRDGAIWTALTTQRDWGEGVNRAAIQWFQVEATTGNLLRHGLYGATALHYFYPAVMPDAGGNMAMAFSRCGAAEFASFYLTGRQAGDPSGSLQPSALVQAGVANYVMLDGSGRNRWGDYTGIAFDPFAAGSGQVWVHGGYASAANQWSTWVGSS